MLMRLFNLDPTWDGPAKELPHHQLQWLEIAMVLAGGPDVLLLDEPTAGMSPDETRQTAQVLKHLNGDGLTIIVVEHDIAFVREVAQVVTVLHQGRIFAEGSVAHDHGAPGCSPNLFGAGLAMAADPIRQRLAGRLWSRRGAAGRVYPGRAGRGRGRAGPKWRRQEHADAHADRAACLPGQAALSSMGPT